MAWDEGQALKSVFSLTRWVATIVFIGYLRSRNVREGWPNWASHERRSVTADRERSLKKGAGGCFNDSEMLSGIRKQRQVSGQRRWRSFYPNGGRRWKGKGGTKKGLCSALFFFRFFSRLLISHSVRHQHAILPQPDAPHLLWERLENVEIEDELNRRRKGREKKLSCATKVFSV
jgi:hypothetical protein